MSALSGAAIVIEDVVKEYRTGEGKPFRAVNGLSLTVQQGEILAFLGPNGAGKTTTIKMMLGLVVPDQGRITVAGLDVAHHRPEVLRRVGAVLEGNRNIYWELTVWENLRYWGTLKQVPPRILTERMNELMGFFGLAHKRNAIGKQLSRGMQQKLAIACALLHDPEILLLDEPTLGLDVAASRMVKERVLQLAREQGRTIVLTTHQLDIAQELCERVAIVSRGEIRALERKENLIALFTQQAYHIRAEGAIPVDKLRAFGEVELSAQPPVTEFTITLANDDGIYQVMDALHAAGVRILAVNKQEANLEEVFLQITEGRSGTHRQEGQPHA